MDEDEKEVRTVLVPASARVIDAFIVDGRLHRRSRYSKRAIGKAISKLMQDFAQGKRTPPLNKGDPLPTAALAISAILEEYATEILRTN